MDTMVIMGIGLAGVGLVYLAEYGLKRLSRWEARVRLEKDDTDMWEWDNLAAADVRDRIRHNVRNHNA